MEKRRSVSPMKLEKSLDEENNFSYQNMRDTNSVKKRLAIEE